MLATIGMIDMKREFNAGIFEMSSRMAVENTAEVAEAFAVMQAVVTRAEHLLYRRVIEYTALSPLFDDVEEGCMIPKYEILITKDDDTSAISVEAIKIVEYINPLDALP